MEIKIIAITVICFLIFFGFLTNHILGKEAKEEKKREEEAELERFNIVLNNSLTKSQVAAISHIEEIVCDTLRNIRKGYLYENEIGTKIEGKLEKIQNVMTEYELDRTILTAVKEKIYKALASKRNMTCFAASFAKKHNL